MTLAELITACQAGFASVAIHTKRDGAIEISSGGNDVPGDANLRTEPAALYATEELAMMAWLRQFDWVKEQENNNALIWIEKPYVETYRITLGDAQGTYRVVRDRYVVRGRVAFEAFVAPYVEVADEPNVEFKVEEGGAKIYVGDPVVKFDPSEFKEVKVKRKANAPLKIKPKRKTRAA